MTEKIDMLNGGVVKKIIRFTIPIMLQGILQSLYNSADLIIVGRFSGDVALSAVGATSAIFNALLTLFLGISAGVDVVLSFHHGMRDNRGAKQVIDTAVISAPILGLLLTILGVFLAEPLLILMKTPVEGGVLEGATIYLQIIMCGMPFTFIYNFCAAIFRTAGETQRPFIYLAISGAVNVALNIIFVAVFHLGVVGVAIATVISQIVSAILILVKLLKNEGLFSFSFKNMAFSWQKFGKMIRVGIPAGIQNCAMNVSNAFLQSGVNSFGKDAMAGSTAVATVEGLLWVTLTSFQSAATTFISKNIGAGKIERVNKILYATISMTAILGLILGLGSFLLADPILSIFIKDNPIALVYGYDRLKITFPIYFLAGIMGVMPGAIRGLGYSTAPSLIALFGACGIRIIWIYTIFKMYPSLSTLYLVHPITWVITNVALVITYIVCYKIVKKRMMSNKSKVVLE
ncbi:MAG: MATE family efflux transporter [Clostridia bacterium]|nr:MATE family efflux transporter [Clostridia bacterium]